MGQHTPTWAPYWGKTDRAEPSKNYHLLAYHNLDVAAVLHALLEADQATERRLARLLCTSERAVRRVLTFLIALHDVGKFDESFQNLAPDLFRRLRGRSGRGSYDVRHDTLGWLAWEEGHIDTSEEDEIYAPLFSCAEDDALAHVEVLLHGIFGHHGLPVQPSKYDGRENQYFRDRETREAIIAFCEEARQLLLSDPNEQDAVLTDALDRGTLRRASWALAGLYVLCDWIGSDSETFTYEKEVLSLEDYWNERALPAARQAIAARRLAPPALDTSATFTSLFPHLANHTPRPTQQWASDFAVQGTPQLFIIEDETGSGKTEAALLIAHALMKRGCGQGVYVGLPTMATANAMYGRFAESYRNLFEPDTTPSIVLAHGRARLQEEFRQALLRGADATAHYGSNDDAAEAECLEFFVQNRNLALLADIGVGTIDQALLGVVAARHQSLRLFALGRRILVIDEVHAYDTYTHQLVCNLLAHHAAQGGSAILLSATLPSTMKQELNEAFARGAGYEATACSNDAYPLITHSCAGMTATHDPYADLDEAKRPENHSTQIAFVQDEDAALGILEEAARRGECACWIRNTVRDARGAYDSLLERLEENTDDRIEAKDVTLFHARMTMEDRNCIEQNILKRFGKESDHASREGRIVIATQVVEQSLDLDFDVMITDLCPIDLILQRLGRYRRHTRDIKGNRAPLEQRGERTFHILAPSWNDQPSEDWFSANFGAASYVYRHHGLLWRTMRALRDRSTITLPEQNRDLVEEVYDPADPLPDGLQAQEDSADGEDSAACSQADFNMLALDDGYGNPSSGAAWPDGVRVPTRLGDPTVTLRLARIIEDKGSIRIEPWASHHHPDPWLMSEVSIRMTRVDGESIPSSLERMCEAARLRMRDRGRYALLVPLRFDDTTNRWEGVALRGDEEVTITYTETRGAEVL
jgi:CRISPR-associated endonuclease/helicase Cas3